MKGDFNAFKVGTQLNLVLFDRPFCFLFCFSVVPSSLISPGRSTASSLVVGILGVVCGFDFRPNVFGERLARVG
jgi:hypothetical protein